MPTVEEQLIIIQKQIKTLQDERSHREAKVVNIINAGAAVPPLYSNKIITRLSRRRKHLLNQYQTKILCQYSTR